MNPFTTHPQQQGITYYKHCCFAMGIAFCLLNSGLAFVVHALFPFISISPRRDLEATAAFIAERNEWIETAKENNIVKSSLSIHGNDTGVVKPTVDNAPMVL